MTYDTTMFIEIEGTKAELRALQGIDGLELPRGATDLGGGRFKVRAFVQRKGVLLDLQARKLTVRVVRDEADVTRKIGREFESFKRTRGHETGKPPPPHPDQTSPPEPDQQPPGHPPDDGGYRSGDGGDKPGDGGDKSGSGPKGAD